MKTTSIHRFLGLFLVLTCFQSYGQDLNFGIKNEKQMDSLSIQWTNTQSVPVGYQLRFPFTFYSSRPFSSTDTAFTLQPNETKTIKIYSKITHNIRHNAEWVLTSDHWSGDMAGDLQSQGKYTKQYYNSTQDLAEDQLKTALKTVVSNNPTSFSYNVARDHMYAEIDNHDDSVTCIYTNRKAKFNTRAGATSNNFNCEHTFPQGFFGSDPPMVSDLHHLFSTDENANNSRSSLPFGVASPPFIRPEWNAPSINGNNQKYEPQDSHKGNCARAMMYFVVHYQDYTNFFAPQQAILRQWNKQFPPLPKDTMRNHQVFSLQTNRNPFVDYPQFADRITNLIASTPIISVSTLNTSREMVDYGSFTDPTLLQSQLVIWNEGKLDGQLSNLQFVNDQFEWVSTPAQTVSAGNSNALVFKAKSTVSSSINDTLKISTNDPIKPVIAIPLTGLFTSVKNGITWQSIRLAPNPARESIEIKGFTSLSPNEIIVTDAMGRLISAPLSQNKLDISALSPGIYYIRILTNSRWASAQFSKE